MIKKVLLPICTAILLGMLNWGCHREPIEPTPDIESGGITVEPIVVNGEETGYTLSYRSWIVPETGAEGNKLLKAPKAESKSNDTVSVILHDEFYHVDTVGYVTNWQPEKYQNGSYTCHWDYYAAPRPPEDYIIITDSTSILRIQFEEFSFSYRIDFEVATYNNGVINKQMPHYTPVVTDLGLQGEPEVLETICRNDSVFARRVLHHAIKVAVGDKVQTLHAKVTLYRHMPNANPSRFITRSELVGNITETYVPTDSVASYHPLWKWDFNVKLHFSNGEVKDTLYSQAYSLYIKQENLSSLCVAPYVSCDELHTYTYSHTTYGSDHVYFHYNGTDYSPSIRFIQPEWSGLIYDDGYTVLTGTLPAVNIEYSRTRYACYEYLNDLYTYAYIVVNNAIQQEIRAFMSFE